VAAYVAYTEALKKAGVLAGATGSSRVQLRRRCGLRMASRRCSTVLIIRAPLILQAVLGLEAKTIASGRAAALSYAGCPWIEHFRRRSAVVPARRHSHARNSFGNCGGNERDIVHTLTPEHLAIGGGTILRWYVTYEAPTFGDQGNASRLEGMGLAIVTTLGFAPAVTAEAPSPSKRTVYYRQVSGRLHHNYIRSLGRRGGRVGYTCNLVGNPDSGPGFCPLPIKYRIGAWRCRLTHRRPYWQNPVLFAIAADAARYNFWIPGNREHNTGRPRSAFPCV
jgi:hypothetical protein